MTQMKHLLAFLDEPFKADWFADLAVDGVDHAESGVLSKPEIATVLALTVWGRGRYGYGDSAQGAGLLPWKR
jgi:hypothetical protein